jgi:hypothetical protein
MRLNKGLSASEALGPLDEVIRDLTNIQATISINEYVAWVSIAELQPRRLFAEPDLAGGLQTTRFWQLFNWIGSDTIVGTDLIAGRHRGQLEAEIRLQLQRLREAKAQITQLQE